jgi:hypothetical protein
MHDIPHGIKKCLKKTRTPSFFITINYHNKNGIKQNLMKIFSFFYFDLFLFLFFI